MKIGIICAMEEEIRILQTTIHKADTTIINGIPFTSGRLGEHEVVIVQSGIGKVLAGTTAGLLLSHFQVEVVLNSGSAGGLGEDLAVGDVVLSTKLAYFDVDVTAFGYEYGQMAGMPLFYEADTQLLALAEQVATTQQIRFQTGLIVTGDTFVQAPEVRQQIKTLFPEVCATEMEGAAIAQVAYQATVPFLVIRAISDNGDESASGSFDEFILEAGKKSAELVIGLVQSI